ncbi:DUF4013 domain-containing protein [Halorarum salinum]|uniref:DUF4013 domain-containing protein n=1 Tax=Halorarum salinum TaxID=2743089 RepID=A0A7D5QI25_9EURY|nr:DUF4013 domain-containing protein [Halobaculum salinum]QLG63363.1 DUF4013 domain-containing protein [Halobaculum salinum]
MLTNAFDYLRDTEDWIRTVVIGGVLGLFGLLLVPAFLVLGYLMRVLRATMRGDEDPPVFDDWGDLAVDGLKAFVVTLAYGFVPGVVMAAAFAFGFAGFASGSDAGALTGGLVLLVGGLVAALLGLAAAYVVPAALLNYVEEDRLGAGFAFGEIYATLADRAYATAFGYAFVVLLGAGVLSGLLNAVPLLGTVAGAFIGFYASVMAAYIFGTTYAGMDRVRVVDDESADEKAAI